MRDSPSQWYESTCKTVGAIPYHEDLQANAQAVSGKDELTFGETAKLMFYRLAWWNPDTFNGKMLARDQQYCEDVYTKWNEGVKQSISAERLLVFNVKQGWQPLCEFLGVPVPEGPFPKLWDKETFKKSVTLPGTTKPDDLTR